jgi:hypothetical protein
MTAIARCSHCSHRFGVSCRRVAFRCIARKDSKVIYFAQTSSSLFDFGFSS